jgi:hypothetical protein
MKSINRCLVLFALFCSSTPFLLPSARGAITGQWDFKSGNLTATIGQDIQYLDTDTQAGTRFGTTASFGVSNIAGVSTNVMSFPKGTTGFGGYYTPIGASANGGGIAVNQYTVIMDILFPTNSSGKTRALFVTDAGGEFMVDSANSISYSGGSGGTLTPGVWHRIAVAVDTTNTISLFVDGTKVNEQNAPGGLDGIFAISTALSLFNDANTNSELGYVASIQFNDQKLSDGLIGALGAPVATGILTGPPPNPYVVSEAPTSDLRFPGRSAVSPTPLLQVVLADGIATVNTSTVQLMFNGQTVPATVTRVVPTTTITYQVTNVLAAGSSNFVSLSYADSAANSLGAQYAFYVGSYVSLPASAAGAAGSASTSSPRFGHYPQQLCSCSATA